MKRTSRNAHIHGVAVSLSGAAFAKQVDKLAQKIAGRTSNPIVREYARVVGLDQDEWVGRYLLAHRSTGLVNDDDGWMRFAENASKSRGRNRRGGSGQRLRWTGIAFLVLLVAGLSWFVWTYVHKKVSMVVPEQEIHATVSHATASITGDVPH